MTHAKSIGSEGCRTWHSQSWSNQGRCLDLGASLQQSEAEEESDLDGFPISPYCPQLLGGDAQWYSHGFERVCQKHKEFVKSSVLCKWNLAKAQQGALALHNSLVRDMPEHRQQCQN